MARKRKRRRPLRAVPILIALVLIAGVIWAIAPRTHRRAVRHEPIAQTTEATPGTSPAAAVTAAASPAASPAPAGASPAASPNASPETSSNASPAASPQASGTGAVRVAIIIDDCGQWLQTERGFLQLPIPVTLAVLPHVHYTAEIAQDAQNAGKGVMLHLPMEPVSHIYPGPGEITVAMTDAQVTQQTEDDVAQVPAAAGVNNHEGSEASADARIMKDVLAVMKSHGLFFIDSRTSAATVGETQARADGVPTAARDVFLDDKADLAYTERMLQRTLDVAQSKGSAIAIGHPKPSTLAALQAMYPRMQAAGVQFVLASDLVH